MENFVAKDDIDSDDSGSDFNEQDDNHFTIGGKRGFNTNIDDFLNAFGTIVNSPEKEDNSRATRRKALAKSHTMGPLLRFGTSMASMTDVREDTQTDADAMIPKIQSEAVKLN